MRNNKDKSPSRWFAVFCSYWINSISLTSSNSFRTWRNISSWLWLLTPPVCCLTFEHSASPEVQISSLNYQIDVWLLLILIFHISSEWHARCDKMKNLIWAKSLRISPAVKWDFSFQLSVFRTSNRNASRLICLNQISSRLEYMLETDILLKGKQWTFFPAVDNMFLKPFPRLMSDFIFSLFFSQASPIKTSCTGEESRQTVRLINQQEGQKTDWQRTIKFDYQTLSPDALYLFPAIRLWCFLNEKPAAGPIPDLSVGEESKPANTDADQ